MLNSHRIFGTCQHFSTKCKEVKEKESLAEKYFFVIIDKNIDGKRRQKINEVSQHLSVQNISKGSKMTFRPVRALVESWCILTEQA